MKPGRASATARMIAAATVLWHRSRTDVDRVSEESAWWCAKFLETSRTDRILLWSVRSRAGTAWWRLVESLTVPGIVAHWMRRKRILEQLVRRAAAEGFTQFVVLGAGLDSLACRLAGEEIFGSIISADHPATLGVVRAAMRRCAEGPCRKPVPATPHDACERAAGARNVEFIAVDLATANVAEALGETSSFDRAQATVFLIEGVLMYLPEAAVASLLESLSRLPVPRARLLASWMVGENEGTIGFVGQSGMVSRWLGWRGEPMLWASTPDKLPAFLAEHGWSNPRILNPADEAPACTSSKGLPQGEQLVIAERTS